LIEDDLLTIYPAPEALIWIYLKT